MIKKTNETSFVSALKYNAMNETLSFRNRVVAVEGIMQRAMRFDESEAIPALVRVASMSNSSNHDSKLIADAAVRELRYIEAEGSTGEGSAHLSAGAKAALINLRR